MHQTTIQRTEPVVARLPDPQPRPNYTTDNRAFSKSFTGGVNSAIKPVSVPAVMNRSVNPVRHPEVVSKPLEPQRSQSVFTHQKAPEPLRRNISENYRLENARSTQQIVNTAVNRQEIRQPERPVVTNPPVSFANKNPAPVQRQVVQAENVRKSEQNHQVPQRVQQPQPQPQAQLITQPQPQPQRVVQTQQRQLIQQQQPAVQQKPQPVQPAVQHSQPVVQQQAQGRLNQQVEVKRTEVRSTSSQNKNFAVFPAP